MDSQLLYQVALTLVPQIGPVQAKQLLQHLTPKEIFAAKRSVLEKIEGIGSFRADMIRRFRDFQVAEKEIAFIEHKKIKTLFLGDPAYPNRLNHCYDPPTLLYMKGNVDLNGPRIIGVIGTRNHSDYGKQMTEKLVRDLVPTGALVISGLAYGVDAVAHRAALKNDLRTVGVLAHGINQLYPPEHLPLAKEMVHEGGGILTEFSSLSKPDKHNFPIRNRVVAGLCDAIVVVESGIRGGSMITAELANGYNRDVFAFPGKTTDAKSAGCNQLIRTNKAVLLTDASELIEMMGWSDEKPKTGKNTQRKLFIELTPEETNVVNLLKTSEGLHIDDISLRCGLNPSTTATTLLGLEFKAVVECCPGRRYRLV